MVFLSANPLKPPDQEFYMATIYIIKPSQAYLLKTKLTIYQEFNQTRDVPSLLLLKAYSGATCPIAITKRSRSSENLRSPGDPLQAHHEGNYLPKLYYDQGPSSLLQQQQKTNKITENACHLGNLITCSYQTFSELNI